MRSQDDNRLEAFWLTIELAVTVSLILLVVGLPVAHWIAFSNWRWKFLVEAAVGLPIGAPANRAWILRSGRAWPSESSGTMVGIDDWTFPSVYIHLVGNRIDPVQPALCRATVCVVVRRCGSEIARGVVDSRCIPHPHFLPCDWPTMSIPGIVTGANSSFAHTMGEFGVVLMVGGNIQGVTRTISIDIYDRVQSVDSGANDTALILLVSVLAPRQSFMV